MSIKIYNAYKINLTSFDEILEKLEDLRWKILEACKDERGPEMNRNIQRKWCELAWGQKTVEQLNNLITRTNEEVKSKKMKIEEIPLIKKETSFLDYEMQEYRKRIYHRPQNTFDSIYDYELELLVFTQKNQEGKTEYYCTCSASDASVGVLNKIPYLQDFKYWDNVEEPEGMSSVEWNKRKKVWESFMDDGGLIPIDEKYTTLKLISNKTFWKYLIVGKTDKVNWDKAYADELNNVFENFFQPLKQKEQEEIKTSFLTSKFLQYINDNLYKKLQEKSVNIKKIIEINIQQKNQEMNLYQWEKFVDSELKHTLQETYQRFLKIVDQFVFTYPSKEDCKITYEKLESLGEMNKLIFQELTSKETKRLKI